MGNNKATKNTAKKKTTTSRKSAKSSKPATPTKSKQSDESREDRSQQRIPINLLVDYRASGSYLFDFCKDLGSGGVFIETKKPLPKGSKLELTFTIPDSKETVDTSGEVIWVQDKIAGRDDLTPGMGVQFSSFDDEKRKLLEDFVHRYHAPAGNFSAGNSSNKQPA